MQVHLVLVDALGHQLALFVVGGGLQHLNQRAFLVLRKNVLAQLGLVVLDDRVGRLHDVLGGAVVLLQLEDLQLGVVLLEVQNVLNISAPEGVDALRVVAHHADVAVLGGQLARNQVLGVVRVLVLIHHHELEQVLVLVEHRRVVP